MLARSDTGAGQPVELITTLRSVTGLIVDYQDTTFSAIKTW